MEGKEERVAAFDIESTNPKDFIEPEKLPDFMAPLSELPGQFPPVYLALKRTTNIRMPAMYQVLYSFED